jgi:BarA-like signal transduction histidine kinase
MMTCSGHNLLNKASLYSTARIAIVLAALIAGASDTIPTTGRFATADRMSHFPRVILWAWERREDLAFIDPNETAVAYLARTLDLSGDGVVVHPRFQPLMVPQHTMLIAVVRIENDRRIPPTLSASQRVEAARIIAGLVRTSPAAIQIDFDARRSERVFYSDLLTDVRSRMPHSIRLSMTALASWCLDDDWIAGLPVDEAVPMIYRMGPDAKEISTYLRSGGQFAPTFSRNSIGLSLDAQVAGLAAGKRVYLFSPRPWTADALRIAIRDVAK